MSLSLARWEYDGCSAGWWMVRELPGVTITLVESGFGGTAWVIDSKPELFDDSWDGGVQDSWALAEALWGEGFSFTDISVLPERRFTTRSEALLALERAFTPSLPPSLSGLIS